VEALIDARERMIQNIGGRLDDRACQFLRSFHGLEPEWGLLGLPGVEALPAVRWKLQNLGRLRDEQRDKYQCYR